MRDEAKERWMELCEQAANEQDPKRLTELISEILLFLKKPPRQQNYTIEIALKSASLTGGGWKATFVAASSATLICFNNFRRAVGS